MFCCGGRPRELVKGPFFSRFVYLPDLSQKCQLGDRAVAEPRGHHPHSSSIQRVARATSLGRSKETAENQASTYPDNLKWQWVAMVLLQLPRTAQQWNRKAASRSQKDHVNGALSVTGYHIRRELEVLHLLLVCFFGVLSKIVQNVLTAWSTFLCQAIRLLSHTETATREHITTIRCKELCKAAAHIGNFVHSVGK